MTDDEFAGIVAEAFARWVNVDCGDGRRPSIEAVSAGLVDAGQPFYCQAEPALNVGVWSLPEQWLGDDTHTFGNTRSVTLSATGEIVDADVELNATRIQLEYPPSQWRQVLLAIATHEAGHVLGLAHSAEDGSTMQAAQGGEPLLAQQLSADDIAGVCALYPPTNSPARCGAAGVADAVLSEQACTRLGSQADVSPACSFVQASPSRFPAFWWLPSMALLLKARRQGLKRGNA